MGSKKEHQLNMRLSEEEYGWLVRYADRTDQSMASIARKALRLYIAALTKKQKTQEKEANEAKGDLFITSDEIASGTGVQTNRNVGESS